MHFILLLMHFELLWGGGVNSVYKVQFRDSTRKFAIPISTPTNL